MVAGHLQEKNGIYYAVLSYKDPAGKRKQPWISTGVLVRKGNKKKAEQELQKLRREYVAPARAAGDGEISPDMPFADYMEAWLLIIKSSVAPTTYCSYSGNVKKKIVPYFRAHSVTLAGLQARHLQSFYLHELQSISASSVIREHANLHKALKYAVKMDLIPFNPADRVERPRAEKHLGNYYNAAELETLFEASREHKLGLFIQMAAFYGLRRSELLGLRWDAFDFEKDTITIRHILTEVLVDGKLQLYEADRAKTKSSLRSLPLVGQLNPASAPCRWWGSSKPSSWPFGTSRSETGRSAATATTGNIWVMCSSMRWAISSNPAMSPTASESSCGRRVCGTSACTTCATAAHPFCSKTASP